ncbi:hypothetical protein C8R43DRAFT_1126402 [Mycena crocata]|nr:hypothetical protein C8R43DRAFT_1126402 [Mycena crocata]
MSIDLNEDILQRILVLCDVQSVLRIGQANKLLHKFTSTREVWLALIQDLLFRGLIDVLPEEIHREATPTELAEEVKRAVLGPQSWLPTSASQPVLRQ